MVRQQLFHIVLRIGQAGLYQVLGQRPQTDDLPGVKASQQHQPVKAVVFRIAMPAFQKRLFKKAFLLHRPQGAIAMHLHIEHLHPLGLTITGNDLSGFLSHHTQTEIFQRG